MRWASGVTTMMQRPVGVVGVGAPGPERDADGAAGRGRTRRRGRRRRPCRCTRPGRRSWRRRTSCWPPSRRSSRPPRRAPGRASTARSVSISVIEPLTRPCSSRKASSAWAMTSTRALPMPTTSKRASPARRGDATAHAARRPRVAATPAGRTSPGDVAVDDRTQPARPLDPYRLPRGRRPARYDVELEPDLGRGDVRRARSTIAVDVVEPIERARAQRHRARHRRACTRRRQRRRRGQPRRGDRAARRRRPPAARSRAGDARRSTFTGIAQRQAARLLPQHVHRRRRHRARDRHHPDAGHRLPAGVPVLGRARLQGGVRRSRWSSTRR